MENKDLHNCSTHEELSHPNVHRAFSPWAEDQKLYVACAYTNPRRSRVMRNLLHDCRKRMEAAPNVEFYAGEVAYGDRPFEVTCAENPRDIQFRSSEELFHKENILNLVAQRFPQSAQYFAYIDGDVLMSRPDWALEAVHLLQHYDAIQLFSQFTDMDAKHRPVSVIKGFVYRWSQDKTPELYLDPTAKPKKVSGIGCGGDQEYQSGYGSGPKQKWWGATGLAWAFRKSAWNTFGGLFDKAILGSSDWYMAYGLAKLTDFQPTGDAALYRAIRAWQNQAGKLDANIWYMDNHITHFHHGPKARRFYKDRDKILIEHKFDPYIDLKRDWQGLYQLSGDKPGLRDDIRAYFLARTPDDPNLAPGEHVLIP